MNRRIISDMIAQLSDISEKLEMLYRPNIEAAETSAPPLRPANDDVSECEIAAEAIEDAINALTRELSNV